MDLNRPFGDGRDNDGDNIVDEPDEAPANATWDGVFGSGPVQMDLNNDGRVDANDANARLWFARHLYCLMMLLKDPGYRINLDGNRNNDEEETARHIAQWGRQRRRLPRSRLNHDSLRLRLSPLGRLESQRTQIRLGRRAASVGDLRTGALA